MNLRLDRPRMVKILQIESETPTIKTLYFTFENISATAEPGQFVMVWIPKLDEIPISLSSIKPQVAITVKAVGDATEALCNLEVGDHIGIRGPYGNSYSLEGQFPLIVGGGIGMAPFLFLINQLQDVAQKITVINGARTQSEILYLNKLHKISNNKIDCVYVTDDGSYGQRGNASEVAIQKLKEGTYDQIYTCGPEIMMWTLFNAAEKLKIPMQTCLERLMKCGIGLCGQCSVDPIGYRVCIEGPVFNSEILRKISDFGKFQRNFAGHKSNL